MNPTPLTADDSPLAPRARLLIEDLHRQEREKALVLPTDDPLDAKRRHRVEHTRSEMWAQPEAVRRTLVKERRAIAEAAAVCAKRPLDRIVMVGCGDSLACMLGVRSMFEQLLGIPCEPIQALDFTYYYAQTTGARVLVVVLSSSGVTTRAVEALLLARAQGALTLGLSNTPGSPVMTEADLCLTVHAERKGWPTQASTAAMMVLYQFGLDLARARGGGSTRVDDLETALHRTPDSIAQVLESCDGTVAAIAEKEAHRHIYLYSGGGPAYACAMFGAAKVKECATSHAIAIPLEEYHHYNSQKAGDPLFLIAPRGPSLARALNTAVDGRRWGGQVYAVTTEGDTVLAGSVDQHLELPEMPELLVPMVYTVPVQLFAYHTAMAKFRRAEESAG
ncbi:MAG: SIS domain-containing protein, partial [Acidobacteria bacterium]|nr:SIS domain-containing protein [Acidobacteriota bacterium]